MAKRIVMMLAFLFGTLGGSSSVFSAETFIVSGNPYAPPVVWEEYKQLAGVAPDLVKEIFDELSLPYSVRVLSDWDRVQEAAKKGEIDLCKAELEELASQEGGFQKEAVQLLGEF